LESPLIKRLGKWYREKVGKGNCPIVDTWWQTETGGILISTLAGVTESRATFASLPLPGIAPVLLSEEGDQILQNNETGNLCFNQPWPSMARGIWGDDKKFFETYFAKFSGYCFAGDGAFRSDDGLFRVIRRVDDVIKISGHRLGTAGIENAINMHEQVSESAVIGYPHDITGEAICAFVIMKKDKENSATQDLIKEEILTLVRASIGAIAKLNQIYIVSDLPKTRSGKTMRRHFEENCFWRRKKLGRDLNIS
jgi:acetyl-CoA synthetase